MLVIGTQRVFYAVGAEFVVESRLCWCPGLRCSPLEICGGKSGIGTGFSPVHIIPPILHTRLYLTSTLIRKNMQSLRQQRTR